MNISTDNRWTFWLIIYIAICLIIWEDWYCLSITDIFRSKLVYIPTASQMMRIFGMVPCYASAFRRRRHYVFGLSVCPSVRPSVRLSVCPSVRPKPEIPSFDLYIGPLVHPTNRNRFTACPSVCPSVRLSVRPSGEVSGHLPENAWREWPEILHADVSGPSSELISLWPRSVDFPNFGAILT